MIKLKQIRLRRAEGLTEECNHSHFFRTFEEAQARLFEEGKSAPDPHDEKHSAYDKTDFTVIWEDGETYSGRYDMHFGGLGDGFETLQEHIKESLEFYAGINKPGHWSDQDWVNFCKKQEEDGTAKNARDFLGAYELPDSELQQAIKQAAIKEYMKRLSVLREADKLQEQINKEKAEREAKVLPAKYPHLTTITASGLYSSRCAIKNIRAELKKHFPAVKFSVRFEHHSTVNVSWIADIEEEKVETVCNKFKGGYFDGMDDSYHDVKCPFTDVFGRVEYIFYRKETR